MCSEPQRDLRVDVDDVRAALATVVDPCSIATGVPVSLADMGMLREVAVEDGDVTVTVVLTSPICWQAGMIVEAAEAAVLAVAGVRSVRCTVDHDAEWLPTAIDPEARRRLRAIRPTPAPRRHPAEVRA